MVVFARFNFGDKVMRGFNIRNYSILELSNLGLKGVTTIKEEDIIAALFN